MKAWCGSRCTRGVAAFRGPESIHRSRQSGDHYASGCAARIRHKPRRGVSKLLQMARYGRTVYRPRRASTPTRIENDLSATAQCCDALYGIRLCVRSRIELLAESTSQLSRLYCALAMVKKRQRGPIAMRT